MIAGSSPADPYKQLGRTIMLRIIAQESDGAMAANVGGDVFISTKTFDVDLPELEAYLMENNGNTFSHRQVKGVEVIITAPVEHMHKCKYCGK